ncbi:MAG: hypothetical protein AAFR04_09450 [Pseudomonadota bacterium]
MIRSLFYASITSAALALAFSQAVPQAWAGQASTGEFGDSDTPASAAPQQVDQRPPLPPLNRRFSRQMKQCVSLYSPDFDRVGHNLQVLLVYRWCDRNNPSDCTKEATQIQRRINNDYAIKTLCVTSKLREQLKVRYGILGQTMETATISPDVLTPRGKLIPRAGCIARRGSYHMIKSGNQLRMRNGPPGNIERPKCSWTTPDPK